MSKILDILKKCGNLIKEFFVWLYLRFMRFFEDHKYLHVTHTKYDVEGKVVDTLV